MTTNNVDNARKDNARFAQSFSDDVIGDVRRGVRKAWGVRPFEHSRYVKGIKRPLLAILATDSARTFAYHAECVDRLATDVQPDSEPTMMIDEISDDTLIAFHRILQHAERNRPRGG